MARKNDRITYEIPHVRGLQVDDIEALARHLQVPQVDPQVVRGHERLPVTVRTSTRVAIALPITKPWSGRGMDERE